MICLLLKAIEAVSNHIVIVVVVVVVVAVVACCYFDAEYSIEL